MLSSEQISNYQEIHYQVFGTTISVAEAAKKATALHTLVKALYQPIKTIEHTAAVERLQEITQQ